MTDNANVAGEPAARPSRWLIRRVVYPLAVIAAIVAVIWWLESRSDDGAGSSGEEYGVRDFAAGLVPGGAEVAAEEGAYAPNFELETLDGGEARLADFRGHPVVLNFWATWCNPCEREIPQFVASYDKYRDDGLVIIGLNMQEGRAIVEPFVEDFGIEFSVLIDRDADVGDKYRLLGLPTTFFIDSEGVIQSIYRGPLEEDTEDGEVRGAIGQTELEQRIAALLGAEGDAGGGG
jgi:peroxiredoxin